MNFVLLYLFRALRRFRAFRVVFRVYFVPLVSFVLNH